MPLQSRLFRADAKLQAAAVADGAHVVRGASGGHVLRIQWALVVLDKANIDSGEMSRGFYGPSTAACVLTYKRKRNVINRSYQTQPDDIVGKMTIASLDAAMVAYESTLPDRCCCRGEKPAPTNQIPRLW